MANSLSSRLAELASISAANVWVFKSSYVKGWKAQLEIEQKYFKLKLEAEGESADLAVLQLYTDAQARHQSGISELAVKLLAAPSAPSMPAAIIDGGNPFDDEVPF